MGIDIAVIGAGSTYTPEIIEGLVARSGRLGIGSIRLMDIDEAKLGIVGGLAARMIGRSPLGGRSTLGGGVPPTRVVLTRDLDEALEGADYVLAQVRVGRLAARIEDERIPLRHGLIGQETTGIGGFFKGLRTIPVVLDIARRMERLCPEAWLVNFSNPSGMVAQAVLGESRIRMVGLCNNAINMYREVARWLGTDRAEIGYLGLNHLSWITSIVLDGRDRLGEALAAGAAGHMPANVPHSGFDPETLRVAGGLPCAYLTYFYYREKALAEQLAAGETRGQVCMGIEEELLRMYADPGLSTKPTQLSKRGGSLYSEAAISLIESLEGGERDVHVVNLRSGGALDFMEDDDVVEIPAAVGRGAPAGSGGPGGRGSCEPIPVRGFSNRHIISLMRAVKSYERHAVKAALEGDRAEALRALAIHPLVGDLDAARSCFDELLLAHRAYLPRFFA